MSDEKLVNIARLMTTYNFEIEQLPEDLKCAHCKLVLKDACLLPCCCRLCRVCMENIMAKGEEFCPGESEDCGESLLSRSVSDYLANKKVSKLSFKCPHGGCVHECQLASMEEHLRECPRKGEYCPFRELGCTQDKLAAEEMGGHLQYDNRRHSEILIEVIANINREIDMLKRELVLKDDQIKLIKDQLMHVQNENESIKNDIKSIKEEKEDLAGRVKILTEEIERETAERRENDELDSARVIEHVDREIAAVTMLIGSNKDELTSQMQSMRGDIGLINQGVQSIKDDICSMKSELESLQRLSYVWLNDFDVDKSKCDWGERLSRFISGAAHPYKYRLALANCYIGTDHAVFCIALRIDPDPNDGQLVWPIKARVDITVSDRDNRNTCKSKSMQCHIDKPANNKCKYSETFQFLHSELKGAGLGLSRGVRVSCVIAPDQV